MSVIGENFKLIRARLGLTQEQFAHQLGIKRSSVGAYEESRANPPLPVLSKLADMSGNTIEDIVSHSISGSSPGNVQESVATETRNGHQSTATYPQFSEGLPKDPGPEKISQEAKKWLEEKRSTSKSNRKTSPANALSKREIPLIDQNTGTFLAAQYNVAEISELPLITIPGNVYNEHMVAFAFAQNLESAGLEEAAYIIWGIEDVDLMNISNGNWSVVITEEGYRLRKLFNQIPQNGNLIAESYNHKFPAEHIYAIGNFVRVFKFIGFLQLNDQAALDLPFT